MQTVTDPKVLERWREGALRYALGERSDPFAGPRAMAHIRSGVVGYYTPDQGPHKGAVIEALYDAEPHTEFRHLPDGTEYPATVWRNLRRP